ncbi:MAG TPA: class I SAM-dependent methyltransferase, partial [Dehalococcoidia bacterium]|nr:class I SAM-dependent methyltransferase [Dehalococcoidia bacterium]
MSASTSRRSARPATSANLRKHTSRNPFQRRLISRFHARIAAQLADLTAAEPVRPRIADLGCGEGFTLEYLALRFPDWELSGIDADPDALAIASLRVAGVQFSQGTLEDLPLPDRSVDVGLCLEVLEHLPDPAAGLREVLRVSRFAIVSVPHQPFFAAANLARGRNWRTAGDDPDHLHHWTAGGFARWLTRYGAVRRLDRAFPWLIGVVDAVPSPQIWVPGTGSGVWTPDPVVLGSAGSSG